MDIFCEGDSSEIIHMNVNNCFVYKSPLRGRDSFCFRLRSAAWRLCGTEMCVLTCHLSNWQESAMVYCFHRVL